MKLIYRFWLIRFQVICCSLLFTAPCLAQLPGCNLIYLEMQVDRHILNYNPLLPVSATNPAANTIILPAASAGLAISPVLSPGSGAGATLTFYCTSSSYFMYYDPRFGTWAATTHRCVGTGNLAAGGGYIFALYPPTGQVYRYDGTGDAVLITTVPGFIREFPSALSADCEGNWYIFNETGKYNTPFLKKYDASGNLLHSWTVRNPLGVKIEQSSGFTIKGNLLYTDHGNEVSGLSRGAGIVWYTIGKDVITLDSVSVRFKNSDVVAEMASCAFNVPSRPEVHIKASETVFCDALSSITFTATPVSGGTTPAYQWSVNGVAAGTSSPVFTYMPAAGDKVACSMWSNSPCASPATAISDTIRVALIASPNVPQAGNNGPVCEGDTVRLTTTPEAGVTYLWTGPDDFRSSEPSPSFVAARATAGIYTLVATKGKCNSLPATTTLVVHPLPQKPDLADADICEGKDLVMKVAEEPNTDYLWSHTTSEFKLAEPSLQITHIGLQHGGQYLLLAKNAYGCSIKDSVQVSVYRGTTLSLSADTAICLHDAATLMATTNAAAVLWSPAAATDAASKTIQVSPSVTTTYTVMAKADHPACADTSGSVTVTILPLPQLRGFDTVVRIGIPFRLQPAYGAEVIKWKWSPAAKLSCADCAQPEFDGRGAMSYQVTVTDSNGCMSSDSVRLMDFCNGGSLVMPNGFTPNGDRKNDIFYVRGKGFMVKSFRIYNRNGQEVFSRNNFPPDDPQYAWEGTFNGQPISDAGGFVYIIEATCNYNGQAISTTGTVFMVR